MIREFIEFIKMAFMVIRYWKIKSKLMNHLIKMSDCLMRNKEGFDIPEVQKMLDDIYRICEEELN